VSRAISILTVTVNYKTAALVENCLAALEKERNENAAAFRISAVVVENASGDADTLREIIARRHWGDWATLAVSERNGGFAYGNNLAFKQAFSGGSPPDYFFLLNPDTEVRPGAVKALVEFMEAHSDVGIVGSSLEAASGQLWPYAFRFPSVWSELDKGLGLGLVTKILSKHVTLRKMGDVAAQVDWFPGASMMIRRGVIETIGGMDEAYFLYYEETDYFRKAKAANWPAWYVPESRVMHMAGQSTGVSSRHAGRLPEYWFESRRRYFAKNHGIAYAMATDVAFVAAHLIGRAKRMLQGRRSPVPPHFLGDFLRNSVILSRNRHVDPAREVAIESAMEPRRV
jgi:N-acetylglucosaminyl-diphospho-decaprenol L-rhamnosyltransferase